MAAWTGLFSCNGPQMSTSSHIGQDDHGDHLTLLTTPTHKSNQRRGLWRNTSATLPTNFSATTEEHSDHCFPRPLSLKPEAHNHSNKRLLSIHATEEDRLEHETTLDAGDFSDAYPQKKKHKHNLII